MSYRDAGWLDEIIHHSALSENEGRQRLCTSLPNSKKARKMFLATDSGKLLIHKATNALWKVSKDGNRIEPVFESDILSEEDVE